MKNIKYSEGDIFIIPLRTQGYGLGLIARKREDILLGYFFDIKFNQIPNEIDDEFAKFKQRVILIKQFGSLGIKKGAWPIVGHLKDWKREAWPVPKFIRHTAPFKPSIITYNDELKVIAEEVVNNDIASTLSKDGLAGYGLIELLLTDLIG